MLDPLAKLGRYMSPSRMASARPDLVAIAGPDAALVVPMASPPETLAFIVRSSAMCQGKITWARSLIIRFLPTATPRPTSRSISSRMLGGLSTTPPVTTHCTPGVRMPLGMSESL